MSHMLAVVGRQDASRKRWGSTMTGILRFTLVFTPLTALLLVAGNGAHASTVVGLYLEPGTNDPTYSGYTRLWCGWHRVCDGVADDPGYGALDFHTYRPEDNVLGAPVLWRMKGFYSSWGSPATVGTVIRTGIADPNRCDYTYGYMYRLDGSYVGRVIYTHVSPYPDYTRYIYGQQPYGFQNLNTWGTYADDRSGCPWDGPHVHQDAQLNYPSIVTDYFRGNYPCEVYAPPTCQAGCVECATPYLIWSAYQVGFHYYR